MANIRSAPSEKAISAVMHSVYGSYPIYRRVQDLDIMYVGSDSPSDPDYVEPFYTYDPDSDPVVEAPIVWDDRHLSYGIVMDVDNQFTSTCENIFTQQFVLSVITKMTPAHTPVYLNYVN